MFNKICEECGETYQVFPYEFENRRFCKSECYINYRRKHPQKKQRKYDFLEKPLLETRLFKIFSNMKTRCYNERFKGYKNYGARGIKVCDEWKNSFQSFYDWSMANGYTDELTIDRIDVNGDYEPSNCRWATKKEQARNRRSNIIVEYEGKKLLIDDLAKQFNTKCSRLSELYHKYNDIKKALSIIKKNQEGLRFINTSGFRGVSRLKSGKFLVRLERKRVCYRIGIFQTFEEAKQARINAEEEYKKRAE